MKFDDSLGEALHVALRKCGDSPAMGRAWKQIDKLSYRQWMSFLHVVRDEFERREKGRMLWVTLAYATSVWIPRTVNAEMLKRTLCSFTKNEWRGFAGFLGTCVIKERKP